MANQETETKTSFSVIIPIKEFNNNLQKISLTSQIENTKKQNNILTNNDLVSKLNPDDRKQLEEIKNKSNIILSVDDKSNLDLSKHNQTKQHGTSR